MIRADTRPGRFVIRGIPVGYAWPSDRVDESTRDEIREAFYIGDRRTITQDVEFAIDQIVEIAIRALSPGINDTFTALSCVDRLGECLVAIDSRRFPPRHHYDEKGVLRLETNPSTQDGVVDAAFHQIRQSSTSNVAVACRLLEVIGRIGDRSDDSLFRDSLRRHARLILESTESEVPSEPDRGEIRERFDAAIEAPPIRGPRLSLGRVSSNPFQRPGRSPKPLFPSPSRVLEGISSHARPYRRLRLDRRLPDRRPGLQGRLDRLALRPAIRLASLLRRAPRRAGKRPMADRPHRADP